MQHFPGALFTDNENAAKAFEFKADNILDRRLEGYRTIWSAGIRIAHSNYLERWRLLEDVYQISLLGALKPGIDPNAAKKALSNLFKISPEIFKNYPEGKKRIVKKGLSLDEAKKYQTLLNRAGAISEIDVVLDRRILAASSVFHKIDDSNTHSHSSINTLSTANTVTSEPDADFEKRLSIKDPVSNFLQSSGFKFDVGRFIPAIYSSPAWVPATDPAGAKIGVIKSTQPVLGRALSLFATVLAAFAILIQGLVFLSAKFPSSAFVTPVMIFIFLMSFVFLPQIFRLKKVLRVMVTVDGREKQICRFRERKWCRPFTRELFVEDDSNRQIARIKKNQFFLTYACTTKSGKISYSANPDMNIEESMIYFGELVREELFMVAALIVQGFGKVKSVANFMKSWDRLRNGKKILIFDDSGSVAAALDISKCSIKGPRLFTLQVKDDSSSEADRIILLAFGLILAGF